MPTIWTIGHSNRPLTDFLELLTGNQIQTVADVRRFPGSRRHPHFSQSALSASLEPIGIGYQHFPTLGGRRKLSPPLPREEGRGEGALNDPPASPRASTSSHSSAWQVAAFAAYADYMLTDDFKSAFAVLADLASSSRTAIMCAEALPWRCHRRLIADQFLAQGWTVLDIMSLRETRSHALPPFAKVTAGQVTYPGNPRPLLDD